MREGAWFAVLLLIAPSGVAAQAPPRLDVRSVEYRSVDDVEAPSILAAPQGAGRYPGVLFVHGRSGWHDRLKAEALRLAERGFVVLAPDYHTGRFIPENPVGHDPKTETDVERGLGYLKGLRTCARDRSAWWEFRAAATTRRSSPCVTRRWAPSSATTRTS